MWIYLEQLFIKRVSQVEKLIRRCSVYIYFYCTRNFKNCQQANGLWFCRMGQVQNNRRRQVKWTWFVKLNVVIKKQKMFVVQTITRKTLTRSHIYTVTQRCGETEIIFGFDNLMKVTMKLDFKHYLDEYERGS